MDRAEARGSNTATAQDVFGRALLDWARGGTTPEVLERDDGFTQEGAGPDVYLSPFQRWPTAERRSVRHLRGPVLDVGCGAGRVALELQHRGIEVVGLDNSPLAAQAARLRGVRDVWCLPIEDAVSRVGSFESLVMFGNNFGIFGTPRRARRLLTALAKTANPRTRIFAESTNPYCGGAPGLDRTYYRRNKERGNAPGQTRLRFRYEHVAGPWFNWLYVSRSDMRLLLRGTGWHRAGELGEDPGEPYVAVLVRD